MRERILQLVLSAMKVRLTRKLAEQIDGIDLEGRVPGDLLDLPPEQARLIIAEEWAIPERREPQRETRREQSSQDTPRRRAADYPSKAEAAS